MLFKARAYAKINLFLDITRKRPDGYHDLDTVMQSVSIYDEISLSLTDRDIVVDCNDKELAGEENIVFNACKAFFDYCGYDKGVHIYIVKNIPVAAGLGGGSADAAAVLYLLNIAAGMNYSLEELIPIAAGLGADVPFCLVGGTCRAQGIGEKLQPLSTPKLYFVLLKERQKQSTGKMYAMLDNTDYAKTGDISKLIEGISRESIEDISSNLFNAFEHCWDFNEMIRPFGDHSPENFFLSGSGSTVGAIFKNKANAVRCAQELASKGYNAFFAESKHCGIEIV